MERKLIIFKSIINRLLSIEHRCIAGRTPERTSNWRAPGARPRTST
jgi:hypothetical protein